MARHSVARDFGAGMEKALGVIYRYFLALYMNGEIYNPEVRLDETIDASSIPETLERLDRLQASNFDQLRELYGHTAVAERGALTSAVKVNFYEALIVQILKHSGSVAYGSLLNALRERVNAVDEELLHQVFLNVKERLKLNKHE